MHIRRSCQLQRCSRGRGDRGVVLILAVFAVVLLTVLAVGITAAVRVELLASRTSLNRVQSLFLAEAGLHEARAILLYDDATNDSLLDAWGPLCEHPLDIPQEMGAGLYRVRVHDACGRLNINELDHVTLIQLTGDPEVAAAIIDWRDAGNMARPAGAEADYYAALPQPYVPRNGPFQTLGELLLVRGVTPGLFFGDEERPGLADVLTVESFSPNTDARGQRRTGLNEFRNWSEARFREQMMEKLGGVISMYETEQIWHGFAALASVGEEYTSLSQLATVAGLDPAAIAKLADLVDVEPGLRARGKVNVNTARAEVLAALPGSSPAIAEAIIARREEGPFLSRSEVAELLLIQENGRDALLQMIDHVTTKSSSFIVESMGWTETGRAYRAVRALVRREPEAVTLVCQAEEDWPLPPLGEELL